MDLTAQALIDRLSLQPHPEGGHFAEVFRSGDEVRRGDDVRAAATLIYFLLAEGDVSRWHVVASDEMWHFYEGSAVELLVYDPAARELEVARLGPLDAPGCVRHHVVPRGHWQAARPLGAFGLVGCTVAPGFTFDDFRFVADVAGHGAHFEGALAETSSLL